MEKLIYSILSLFVLQFISAQDADLASKYFNSGNFYSAIDEYALLLEEEPDNIEYNYNIAVSYLNTNIDKSLAIPYLEKLSTFPKITSNVWYLLGRAYHFGYQFEKAINAFKTFIETGKGSDENQIDAQQQINYCENAKELMKFPVRVSFENLGKNVNSAYDDYYPFIPVNESFILFNSTRDKNSNEDESGLPLSNIYYSKVENGEYKKAQALPEAINKPERKEEIVGLNASGTKAILYFEDYNNFGDIYSCDIEGNVFREPVKLGKTINSKDIEIAGCITENGQTLYFASDRDGGYGGVDIYSCQLLPNGEWSEPLNLGPTINTPFDEDFPNISPNGKTLYFSSRGHASMGGYDIFKAEWDETKRKFSGVSNMGYPINTPEDNMNFRVSETGKYGYISAVRKGGYGGLDIYRIDFENVDAKYTVINGKVIVKDNKKIANDMFIQVTDLETGEIYGEYAPNEQTLRYVMILPPGKFEIYIEAPGYKEIIEEIEILDKSSYKSFINKDINLEPAN